MTEITSIDQLDLNKRYSYADYLTWKFKERVELLRGIIAKMPPALSRLHQKLVSNFHGHLWSFLQKKEQRCQIFPAPFDVRLPSITDKNKTLDTVVQPDITVVCDENKLDDQGCVGAPDLVVEVLSPGNSKKEMKHKFELYQHVGIPEYWIVDPVHCVVVLYTLNEKGEYFTQQPFTSDDILKSKVLIGFQLDLSTIFK